MGVEPGTVLGAVELGKLLHKGERTQIYSGMHVRLGIAVDVHVLPGAPAEDRDRFVREARVAVDLVHPTLVPALDFGEHGDVRVLVTEPVRGRTLEQYIAERRRPLSERGILLLLERLGELLEVCHDAGLAHRDLQPSRICVDEDGRLRVSGFGLAPARSDPEPPRGAPLAGMRYLPPDCAGPGRAIDPAADLFSVGAIAYELAFQRLPYKGFFEEEPFAPEAAESARLDLPTHCSAPLLAVIGRLVERNPDRRICTAAALLATLPGERSRERPAGSPAPRHGARAARAAPDRAEGQVEAFAEVAETGDAERGDPNQAELQGVARFLQRWFGSLRSGLDEGEVLHSSLGERLLVWILLVALVSAAIAGLVS